MRGIRQDGFRWRRRARLVLLGAALLAGCRSEPAPAASPDDWETLRSGASSSVWGSRFGKGREELALLSGGDAETEKAVLSGLAWLARHQDPDGGWHAETFRDRCTGRKCPGAGDKELDVAVTAISLLAFLGAGFTPLSLDKIPDPLSSGPGSGFGGVVKRGLKWILARQGPDGRIGSELHTKFMYGQALATQALAEAFGMTELEFLKPAAQRAVDSLVAAQNPGQGWRYAPRAGVNDSSVTGWCVLALWSARRAGLAFPDAAFDGANAWFDSVTTDDFDVGYTSRTATGRVYVPGDSALWADHETLCAWAFLVKVLTGRALPESVKRGLMNRLLTDLPDPETKKRDYVYWCLGSMAVFQHEGPTGPGWRSWNAAMKKAVLQGQADAAAGCKSGSWDDYERWGFGGGGTTSATALNVLTLETGYRYSLVSPTPRK